MSVKIGISLIAWQNDDLPELTGAHTRIGTVVSGLEALERRDAGEAESSGGGAVAAGPTWELRAVA